MKKLLEKVSQSVPRYSLKSRRDEEQLTVTSQNLQGVVTGSWWTKKVAQAVGL